MVITRRRIARLFGLAGLVMAAEGTVPLISKGSGVPNKENVADRQLISAPVKVPIDFLGMHFHRWPRGNPISSSPTYQYGAVRSHDYTGTRWNDIHQGAAVYNWQALDFWVDTHSAHGKTLIFTVFGTPTWLSANVGHADLYGVWGGCAPPKTLEPLDVFVKALVSRYNLPKRRIQFIEIWNEPTFHYPAFWCGSANQLAELGRTIYRAAKAVDPGIKILSPGFNEFGSGGVMELSPPPNENAIYEYLVTPLGDGTTAGQWCDALSIHTYDAAVSDASHGIEGMITRVRQLLRSLDLTLPIVNTEIGYANGPFLHASLEQKATYLRRQAAVQAALGVRAMFFYAHDDDYIGNPSKNREISSALTDINTHLAGATLKKVTLLAGGAIEIHTGKESFVW